MPGGLLSILSYGCNDLYLTGSPQITFFKVVYRRHTNFSIESIEVGYNTSTTFDKEYEIIIPRIGDLVSKTYLKIVLPQTSFSKNKLGLKISSPNNQDKDDAKDNYKVVINFMIFNIKAYRNAFNNIKIENITTTQMLTDIKAVFNSTTKVLSGDIITANTSINNYNTLTEKYNDKTNQTKMKIYTMMNLANIKNILDTYILNPQITPNNLFTLIQSSLDMSIKCQKYFWNEYNKLKLQNDLDATNNLKFAWNENIGYNIIEYIDITLGGESIDRIYGEFLEIDSQLSETILMKNIHNSLIGDTRILTNYDKNPKAQSETIYIPIKCWFSNNIGSAFPLIASQYSDLIIKIKFRSINQCAYIENINGELDIYGNPIQYSLQDLWEDNGLSFQSSLYVDYIYLDGLERRKFAQSSHEYLIETIQTVREKISNLDFKKKASLDELRSTSQMNETADYTFQLDLKHPCKELVWVLNKYIYTENKDGLLRCYFNKFGIDLYSNENTIKNGTITFNGYSKLNRNVGTDKYFNLIQPYQHRTKTPNAGIYLYSFSHSPEDIQPSGTCNFSRFATQQLLLTIKEKAFYYALSDINNITINSLQDILKYTDLELILFAKSYNVIRIHGGFSGLAFSFN
jgi:hypothetical protein